MSGGAQRALEGGLAVALLLAPVCTNNDEILAEESCYAVDDGGFAPTDCDENGVADICDVLPNITAAQPVAVPLPAPPSAVAAGDLDGDGRSDLVLTSIVDSELRVLRPRAGQPGSLAFDEIAAVELPRPPRGVVLADVDGNGALDVLVSGGIGGGFFVFKNDGRGELLPAEEYELPSVTERFVVGDLDGDGNLDAVFISLTSELLLLAGTGGGRFEQRSIDVSFPRSSSFALADLDRDGDLDLLEGSSQSRRIAVHLNDGNGALTLRETHPWEERISDLVPGDEDLDGDIDFVVVGDGVAALYRNRGDATFDTQPERSSIGPTNRLRLVDVDGEKGADIITTGGVVAINNGQGVYVSAASLNTPTSYEMAVGDFNGDDVPDLAVIGRDLARVVVGSFTIAPPRLPDCNGNRLPDSCDIAGGRSIDRSGNGVPDECESVPFRRGDADGNGLAQITDAVFVLEFLFDAGPEPLCVEASDVNNDGRVNITDALFVLHFLFIGTVMPPAPGPPPGPCGMDTDRIGTASDLGCVLYDGC